MKRGEKLLSGNSMVYLNKLFGQEEAVTFLKNDLKKGDGARSYLFSGKEGIGKKLLARQFAQSINCADGTLFTECSCTSCHKIASDMHPDVKWIGLDEEARSIKIEEIRQLQSWINLHPFEGKRKVFIINRAERLTEEAANAFLKILEEPPADTYIILLSHLPFQLPGTIISRVNEIRLCPLSADVLSTILHTEFNITEEAHFLAYQSEGSIGLALRYHEEDYFRLKNTIIDSFLKQDSVDYFLSLVTISHSELDTLFYILCSFFHDVLLVNSEVDQSLIMHNDRREDIHVFSKRLSSNHIIEFMTVLEESRRSLKRNVNSKLILSRLAVRGNAIFS